MTKCRVTSGIAGDIERDLNSFFDRHPGIKIINTTQSTSNIQYPQTYCVVVIYEEEETERD
jgi:hypothetical protein